MKVNTHIDIVNKLLALPKSQKEEFQREFYDVFKKDSNVIEKRVLDFTINKILRNSPQRSTIQIADVEHGYLPHVVYLENGDFENNKFFKKLTYSMI